MAPKNPLQHEEYGAFDRIEDHRWRKTPTGMQDGQNRSLIIDDAAKADAGHRNGRFLKSGVPVYEVGGSGADKHYVKVWDATAKAGGKKILGFLQSVEEIQSRSGVFWEQKAVGVQTRGEIYPHWLPVTVENEDIPASFGVTPM